jgi:DNA repair exonuclease SbcCD ATPase subunit
MAQQQAAESGGVDDQRVATSGEDQQQMLDAFVRSELGEEERDIDPLVQDGNELIPQTPAKSSDSDDDDETEDADTADEEDAETGDQEAEEETGDDEQEAESQESSKDWDKQKQQAVQLAREQAKREALEERVSELTQQIAEANKSDQEDEEDDFPDLDGEFADERTEIEALKKLHGRNKMLQETIKEQSQQLQQVREQLESFQSEMETQTRNTQYLSAVQAMQDKYGEKHTESAIELANQMAIEDGYTEEDRPPLPILKRYLELAFSQNASKPGPKAKSTPRKKKGPSTPLDPGTGSSVPMGTMRTDLTNDEALAALKREGLVL